MIDQSWIQLHNLVWSIDCFAFNSRNQTIPACSIRSAQQYVALPLYLICLFVTWFDPWSKFNSLLCFFSNCFIRLIFFLLSSIATLYSHTPSQTVSLIEHAYSNFYVQICIQFILFLRWISFAHLVHWFRFAIMLHSWTARGIVALLHTPVLSVQPICWRKNRSQSILLLFSI